MTPRAPRRSLPPLTLTISPGAGPGEMLYRHLYRSVRDAILGGRWPPGARLPSTRQLAGELGLSRTTVLAAFELLTAEGYVEASLGSGTFVARNLLKDTVEGRRHGEPRPAAARPLLSQRGKLLAARRPFSHAPSLAFAPGRPDVGLFPFELWSQLHAQCWRNPPRSLADCSDPRGYPPLREAIAGYLREVRALNCTADQVLVTAGAQQAHDLVARTLLDPGDAVWCEEPGYLPSHATLAAAGAVLVPVPVDASGLSVAQGRALAPTARLASIAPSHQYPLGVVMSLARRLELLGWAAEANAWIVEDDYDSEFRYDGRPLASLQGLDREGRVIYVGTFSKILLPALRLGFLVVPDHVAEAFTRARAIGDMHPPILAQPVLARFIADGHLAGHVRRQRRIYQARQAAFLAARPLLDGLLSAEPDSVGIHLVATLDPALQARMTDTEAVARARQAGIQTRALSSFYAGPAPRQGLLIGYACVAEAEMAARVCQLAAALRD